MSKKNSSRKISLILFVFIAILMILFLLFGKGGFGIGTGNGNDGNRDIPSQTGVSVNDTTEEITSAEEVTDISEENAVKETVQTSEKVSLAEVTVSGNEYIYQNGKISIDDLMDALMALDENVTVKINDENSSLKAYKELKEKLEENGIGYIEEN